MPINIQHPENSVNSVQRYLDSDQKSKLQISASAIGKIIDQDQCPRYSRLRVDNVLKESILKDGGKDTRGNKSRGWNDFSPLNSILANEGQRFENSVYDRIENNSKKTIRNYRAEEPTTEEHKDKDLLVSKSKLEQIEAQILSGIKTAVNSNPKDDPVVMLQTPLTGIIGEFSVVGYSDLIVVWPKEGNNVTIRVIDIKASWSEKTSHQLQTATYTTLLRNVLDKYEEKYNEPLEYSMEGGILNRESEFTYPDEHKLPKFELQNREKDIQRMLSKDGEIHRSITAGDNEDFEDIEYQLDNVCQSCEYREVCYADSYDRADIALLGISRGEQKALRENGIETVHQVADLAKESNKSPVKFEQADIKSVHKSTVSSLPKELQLKIPELSQLAKEMLPDMDPSDPNAGSKWLNTKSGVGSANIPDDNPSNQIAKSKLEHPPGKLIKIFINVQEDYVTDRTVLLSASIDAGEFSSGPLQVSESIKDIPVNKDYEFKFDKIDQYEKQLLENFTEKLYTAINTVGRSIGQYPDASVHFYFYTDNEYSRLIDSLKRYENSDDATDSIRDLLSLREGPEQQMYSVLQTEINKLYHIDQLPESLVTLSERFYPDEEYRVNYEDTIVEDSKGNEIELKKEFRNKIFDYSQQYETKPLTEDPTKNTAYIKFRESDIKEDDDYIPFSVDHQGSDIPLEYIWGCEEIDILSPEWINFIKKKQSALLSEDKQIEEEFQKNIDQLKGVSDIFRWIDPNSERLRLEHVEEMSKLLTLYMRQIEADIFYKDSYIEKPQMDISTLGSFRLNKSFEETIEDYIDIEFDSDKSEKMSHYQLSIEERIQTGKSIPVQITDIEDQGGTLLFRGRLAYDDLGFDNPELMAASCRKTGSEGGDSASWMVASLLERNGDTFIEQNGGSPTKLQRSPSTTVERFNTNNMTIEFTHTQFGSSDPKYNTWRNSFITADDEKQNNYQIEVQNGEYIILDPQINSYFANIKTKAIQNAQYNATNQLLKDLQNGTASLHTDQYKNPNDIRKFLRWMRKTDDSITFRPNRKQKQFIKDVESKVSLLQGPPGTGKTSGAIASALAGRIYTASKSDSSVRAIVTGASNKSIDEVTNELADLVDGYNSDTDTGELEDVDIIRLSPYIPDSEKKKNVRYLDYNNKNHESEIYRILQQLDDTGLNNTDSTVQSTLAGTKNHTVILATPSRIHGLMKNYAEESDIEEVYESAPKLFDIMCVDEASMMTLDKFILGGAFMSPNGQWLIAGDHRQMPPVQKFEWTEEKRRNIEQYLPYLSTLNYFRYLRGDDLTDFIDEKLVENQPVNTDIKKTGLEVTYRCHEVVADFLQEWIYDKDNINYRSKETDTIPEVDAETEGIQTALDPESPITLIVHNDTKSKQFNPVEAQIASVLDRTIPESESTGIVTPHNSQKGYLKAVNKDCTVDTVERFQGGQKDAMMISATVSDPNYLSSESEFIFDPRRLNVAISRMKKKLIVIAPRSLFDFIPDDVELYEKSVIWAGLYDEVNGDDESAWSGTLSEFTGKELQLDADVEIYHGE